MLRENVRLLLRSVGGCLEFRWMVLSTCGFWYMEQKHVDPPQPWPRLSVHDVCGVG